MSISIAWSHDFFGARATYTLNKVDFFSEVRSRFPTRRYLWSVNQCFFADSCYFRTQPREGNWFLGLCKVNTSQKTVWRDHCPKKSRVPWSNPLIWDPIWNENHPVSQYIQILGFWASGWFLMEVSALKRLLKYFKRWFLFVFEKSIATSVKNTDNPSQNHMMWRSWDCCSTTTSSLISGTL